MSAISINLLPEELANKDKFETKKSRVIRLSIGVLLVMILISSTTLLVRILQNRSLQVANQQLDSDRAKVASLKDKEGLVFYLKQRLDAINTLSNQESPQAKSFNLITNLAPVGLKISSLSIDKNGGVTLSVTSPTTDDLNSFFNNLTDPEENQGRIAKVTIDSFSRVSGGQYRADLTVKVS